MFYTKYVVFFRLVKRFLKNFGTSISLTYTFNLGSLLGFVLGIQILTGLIIVLYFEPVSELAFRSVQYIIFEVNGGWFFRLLHFNGASVFFGLLYLHFFKALFYSRNKLYEIWFIGLLIFIILIMEAFLGYTLVWSQMSFWAGTVITSLLSVIPVFGRTLVFWVWGGFGLNSNTLKFFYIIHFLVPFVVVVMVFFHLFFLHFYGSSSELIYPRKLVSQTFYPYYWVKDLLNILVFFIFFIGLGLFPFNLGDALGFEEVNELVSPVHIVPEWYFLWAYAILRAVPSKLLGVLTLLMGLLVFFPMTPGYTPSNDLFQKVLVLFFITNGVVLSILGSLEPLPPFVRGSILFRVVYFVLVLLIILV